MENITKTISTPKKKKKKKGKKGNSTKELADEYISQKQPSQVCQRGGVAASHQPSNEMSNHEREKSMKSDSAALSSVHASQMHEFSDQQSAHNCKGHAQVSDLATNLLQTEAGNCNSKQISPCCKEIRSNSCFTFDVQDNHSFKRFKCKPYEITRVMSCKVEDCKGSGSGNERVSQMNSHVCKVHTVTLPDISCKSSIVQHDMVNTSSHQPSGANGKENRTIICKKNDYNVMGAKRSNFNVTEKNKFLDKGFAVKHSKFSGERLLSTSSVCSYEHANTEVPNRAVAESSQGDNKQRFNVKLSRYGMQSNSSKHDNYRSVGREQEVCEPNFIRPFKHNFSQKVSIPVSYGSRHFEKNNSAGTNMCNKQHAVSENVFQSDKSNVLGYGLFNGFREYERKRIPRLKHSFERSSHSSSGSERCSEFNLFHFSEGSNNEGIEKKWIPVAARGSTMQKRSNSGCVRCEFDDKAPITGQVRNDSHVNASIAPLSESSSVISSESECLTSCHKMISSKSKIPNHKICSSKIGSLMDRSSSDSVGCGNKTDSMQQVVIGSSKAMEALHAAYKLQLESESFQHVVKCPLADIERLLRSAAPVISPLHTCEKSNVRSVKWLSHDRLCKHQVPNLPILSVWEWYEEPGSYGLEVGAEDHNSMSFHAYFAPSLSAIQLFYPRNHSYSNGNGYHVEPDLRDKKEFKSDSSSPTLLSATHSPEAVKPSHPHVDRSSLEEEPFSPEPVRSLTTPTCICRGSSRMDYPPTCSTDAELVFEFFESDLPQQRKPLHLKVAELVNGKTNNECFYGDSSKLECSNLQDLHPASWFSVAWYPVYRIPGGKFCASFLTYHSFGFLTQRCNGTDALDGNTCSVVSPVLGLESYNAQDECWFRPKLPSQPDKVAEERLRALVGNASLFARGCVHKDNAKVFNRQPDYEFFVSRKRPPTRYP